MKKFDFSGNMMMEMCMQFRMCMALCAPVSDMFSVSKAKNRI